MLSVERLSSLIGSIYDCVLEPDRWPFALTEICAALRFANGSIGVNALPSGETLLVASVGIPPYWLGRMSGYGDEIMRLWGGVARVREYPFEEPVVCSQATDRATWTNNTWFTEWAAPQGLLDAVSIPLVRDESMLGTLTLARHQSVGPVDDTDLATLRLLAPHARRAVTIGRCFDLKTVEASTFAAVIDALTVAVILVDAQLGIVYANPAASAMLETGGVIGRSNNALRLAATLPMEALRTAVACAAADELTLGRRGAGCARVATAPPSVSRRPRAARGGGGVRHAVDVSSGATRRCPRAALRSDTGGTARLRTDREWHDAARDRAPTGHRTEHGQDTSAACVRQDRLRPPGRPDQARRLDGAAPCLRPRPGAYPQAYATAAPIRRMQSQGLT